MNVLLARFRARPLTVVLTLSLLVQVAPLATTRVLPLHDASGILGLTAAFAHRDNPAARIDDFYDFDFGAYPSVLYFGWGWLAAQLGVPVDLAFHLFLALFCLAGPPLALLLVLRAFGRPPALALLALPVVWHQQIWFGFLGSAAALTMLLLALAFARQVVDRGRPGDHVGLALALLATALAHPFSLALALALVAPVLVAPGRWRARLLRVACFAPTALFLAGWVRSFFTASRDDGPPALTRLLHQLRLERPPLADDLRAFLDWLGGGYRGVVDDALTIVALAMLVAFLIVGVRGNPAASRGRWWLGWALLLLAAGWLLLPNTVQWPAYWWGVRVRCAVPLFLVAIAAIRVNPRGVPVWAVAPAAVAAAAYGIHVTHDFRTHFRGRALAGFDEALAAIPAGQSVLGLPTRERHYTQGHPYLVQHYVVRKGGRAAPYLLGHRGAYWVTMKPAPNAPPWGDPSRLSWHEHGLGWDFFLQELPLDGDAPPPFADAPDGAVVPVTTGGRWRLYRRAVPAVP